MSAKISRFVVGFAIATACMTAWGTSEAKAHWGFGGGFYHASSFGGFGGYAPIYAPPVFGYGYTAGYTHFGHGGYFVPPPRRHFGFSFSYGRHRGFHPGFHRGFHRGHGFHRGFHRGHGFHRGFHRGHGFHRGFHRGRW